MSPTVGGVGPESITVALPKGRLYDPAVKFLGEMKLDTEFLEDAGRRLCMCSADGRFRYVLVRPSDVVTYVAEGVADMGIVGKDTLMEDEGEVYELYDLEFGGCHLSVAAPSESVAPYECAEDFYRGTGTVLRIATKYPRVARRHFEEAGIASRVIYLRGSVELAPLVGLADAIVDLVATGGTLRANGLVEVEHISDITARLVVNPVSLKVKAQVERMLRPLRERHSSGGMVGDVEDS